MMGTMTGNVHIFCVCYDVHTSVKIYCHHNDRNEQNDLQLLKLFEFVAFSQYIFEINVGDLTNEFLQEYVVF